MANILDQERKAIYICQINMRAIHSGSREIAYISAQERWCKSRIKRGGIDSRSREREGGEGGAHIRLGESPSHLHIHLLSAQGRESQEMASNNSNARSHRIDAHERGEEPKCSSLLSINPSTSRTGEGDAKKTSNNSNARDH